MEKQELEKNDSSGDSKKKGTGFFILNLSQIDSMVRLGAGAEEIMAYLVLIRGTGRSQAASTHGAKSIAERTQMTHYRASSALDWLTGNGYIQKIASNTEGIKKLAARWQIIHSIDVQDVALANSLMDGIGTGKNNPPMARIYKDIKIGKHLVLRDVQLDALMVLLYLYKHHLLADCGGVNPRAGVFRTWDQTENSIGRKIDDVEGTNAALYEIEGSHHTMYRKFAAEAMFYIENETERSIRFWDAFNNLTNFGFLYEVIQIWTADPETKINAVPLYTLYIRDRHARNSEPYLQPAIHKVAISRDNLDYTALDASESDILNSGKFRFIASKKTGGFPIGIYRLRFRPATKDGGKGIAAEEKRVQEWSEVLSDLL